MSNPTPRVSVVIPAFQAERQIADCLRSVLDQSYPRERYEVIVVNNGSTDRTAAVAGKFPMRIIDEPRPGVGYARGAGVENARGELVVFTDSDCIADRNWIAALVARFDREPDLGGVGGYLACLNPQTPIQYYITERELLAQEIALDDRPYSAPFIITANALLPRRLIEEAGGFDPKCGVAGEDADLCWRMAEKGRRFVFAPDAVVHHAHRSTVKAFCKWMFRYGVGSVYLLKKHRRRYGLGPIFFDGDHYRLWLTAVVTFLSPSSVGADRWARRFAGYDVLRFACFTAGRVVGSIRHRAVIL